MTRCHAPPTSLACSVSAHRPSGGLDGTRAHERDNRPKRSAQPSGCHLQRRTCLNGGCGHPFPPASCEKKDMGGAEGVDERRVKIRQVIDFVGRDLRFLPRTFGGAPLLFRHSRAKQGAQRRGADPGIQVVTTAVVDCVISGPRDFNRGAFQQRRGLDPRVSATASGLLRPGMTKRR